MSKNTAAELLPRRIGVSISTGLNSSEIPNSWRYAVVSSRSRFRIRHSCCPPKDYK